MEKIRTASGQESNKIALNIGGLKNLRSIQMTELYQVCIVPLHRSKSVSSLLLGSTILKGIIGSKETLNQDSNC
jgi:hypothetical protein